MHKDAAFVRGDTSAPPSPLPRRAAFGFPLEDSGLRDLAASAAVPYPQALQALYHALVARWTGDELTVVATPGEASEWRVTRVDLSDDPAFLDLVQRTAREGAAAERLGWEVKDGVPSQGIDWPPAFTADDLCLDPSSRSFDLSLHARGGGGARFIYRPDRHPQARIERMARDLQDLVAAVPRRPSVPVGLLFAASREVAAVAGTRMARPVHEQVHEWGRLVPDAPAIRTYFADGTQSLLSYGDLAGAASSVSRLLLRRGVRRGQRVAICMDRSPRLVVAVLGVLGAGAACVLLDRRESSDRLQAMLDAARPSVVLAERATRDRLKALRESPLVVDAHVSGSLECVTCGPADAAWVASCWDLGSPAAVTVSHAGLAAQVAALALGPEDVVLGASALSSPTLWLEVLAPLAAGGQVILAAPSRLHDAIREGRATVLHASARTLSRLVAGGWRGDTGLRVVVSGEARLPAGVASSLAGMDVWQLHGQPEPVLISRAGESAGAVPVCGARAYVLDRYLRPLPTGAVGDLYHATPFVSVDPESERLQSDPFVDGGRMLHTGERARWLEDGTLELLGSRERVLWPGGCRVDVREIERVLERNPDVHEVAVSVSGEGVTACVVTGNPSGVEGHARQTLPPALVPSTWVLLEALPRTPDGRLDVSALPGAAHASASRRRPLEAVLSELCADVLEVSRLDVHEDFFALGADSLAVGRLIERIRRLLGVDLDASHLFAAPTVAGLAAVLEAGPASSAGSLVPLRTQGTRAPLYCVHPASGSVVAYHALAARFGAEQPVYGLQAQGLYGRGMPLRSVGELADAYLEEMRAQQKRGPWHLMGFAFGAVVAFELAVRLRMAGEDVGLLALVDGPCPPRGSAPVGGGIGYQAARLLTATGRPLPPLLRQSFFRAHHGALEQVWSPGFYPGRALVVQSRGRFPDATLGWRAHAASVEVVEIRVDAVRHRALLEEPWVHSLARLLDDRMSYPGMAVP